MWKWYKQLNHTGQPYTEGAIYSWKLFILLTAQIPMGRIQYSDGKQRQYSVQRWWPCQASVSWTPASLILAARSISPPTSTSCLDVLLQGTIIIISSSSKAKMKERAAKGTRGACQSTQNCNGVHEQVPQLCLAYCLQSNMMQ